MPLHGRWGGGAAEVGAGRVSCLLAYADTSVAKQASREKMSIPAFLCNPAQGGLDGVG